MKIQMNYKISDLKKKNLDIVFKDIEKLSTVKRFIKLISQRKTLPPLDYLSSKHLIKMMIEYQIACLKNFSYLFNFK